MTEEGELQDTTASTIPSFPLTPTETFKDVVLAGVLPETQQEEALAILAKHQDVLTDRPGRTSEQEFSLRLLNDKPVYCHPYPLPFTKREVIREENQAIFGI